MKQFLIGQRIYLRAVEESDYERVIDWLNNQQTTRYMQRGIYPETVNGCKDYNGQLRSKGGLNLAICLKDKHIGNIALTNIHPTFRSAEISIIIGATYEQGKGYATEAIKLLTGHAFNRMNFNRIQAGAVKDNTGCIKAFEAAGFKQEGTARQAYYCEGKYQDVIILSIIKNEWSDPNA
jgi:RimJ/RimL family protein N-acetyltransferase